MRQNLRKILILTGISVFLLGTSAYSYESLIQKYFKNNPTNVKQLEMKWGKPASVKVISDGLEKRIYGHGDAVIGYTYFIVKDGLVIDQGVTPSLDKMAKKPTKPHLSRIMSWYYEKNNVSLKSRIARYGKPINSYTFPNGMVRTVFNYGDDITGKKFFVSYNGRVLDAGMTKEYSMNKGKEEKEPHISPFMMDWFKKHPMTVSDITKKYGEPISTKEYSNGMKRMIFGPRDEVAGYKYFVVKDGKAIDSGLTD